MKTKPVSLIVTPGTVGVSDGTWMLTEGGVVIARWRHRDMPRLGAFLLVRLEDAIRPIQQKANVGKAQRKGTKAALIRAEVTRLTEMGRDPWKLAPRIARTVAKRHESGECTVRHVNNVLRKLEANAV